MESDHVSVSCSFGADDCHKLTYCRISGLLKLDEFLEDIQEVLTTFKTLRWRWAKNYSWRSCCTWQPVRYWKSWSWELHRMSVWSAVVWWLVQDLSFQHNDVNVKFMHPKRPTKAFFWPDREDNCWVPVDHILAVVPAPQVNKSGCSETLEEWEIEYISQAYAKLVT